MDICMDICLDAFVLCVFGDVYSAMFIPRCLSRDVYSAAFISRGLYRDVECRTGWCWCWLGLVRIFRADFSVEMLPRGLCGWAWFGGVCLLG